MKSPNNKSTFKNSRNLSKHKSPTKKTIDISTIQHSTKVPVQDDKLLLTPTSISMKNAFIIKNADVSFDAYYT